MSRLGQTVRPRGEGGTATGYGSVSGTGASPESLTFALASNQIAIVAWDSSAAASVPTVDTLTGSTAVFRYSSVSADGGTVGNGWITGNGTYMINYGALNELSTGWVIVCALGDAVYVFGS